MILWSKGLGKLVLSMRLSERNGMSDQGEHILIDGTMGEPTFWDYSVNLSEKDVVDFLELLKKPVAVHFLISTPKRWKVLGAAISGITYFLVRTIYRFLGGKSSHATAAVAAGSTSQDDQSRSEHVGA